MEIENITKVDQFMRLLVEQKKTLQNNSKRKGEIPRNRTSRDELVQVQMLKHMQFSIQKSEPAFEIRQSYVGPPYLPSTKLFQDLKKIYIKELKLETHHRGNYIIVKVLTPPTVMNAVMTIAEDEKEQGVMLQLYQQETSSNRALEDLVHVDKVCIIKEPYFKIMNDGGTYVQIMQSPCSHMFL